MSIDASDPSMTVETKPCAREDCDEILTRRPGECQSKWDGRSFHTGTCPLATRHHVDTKPCALDGCEGVLTRKKGQARNRFKRAKTLCSEHRGQTGVRNPDDAPERVRKPRPRKQRASTKPEQKPTQRPAPAVVERPVWRPNAYGWSTPTEVAS